MTAEKIISAINSGVTIVLTSTDTDSPLICAFMQENERVKCSEYILAGGKYEPRSEDNIQYFKIPDTVKIILRMINDGYRIGVKKND